MSLRSFLKQRNIEISLRRYGVDMINYMTWGLFGSLIIGLILKTIGQWTHIDYLTEVSNVAQAGLGAAFGVGDVYGLLDNRECTCMGRQLHMDLVRTCS